MQIYKRTLERLRLFKQYPRQSYDELLNSVFDTLEEEPLTSEEIQEIRKGLDDLKHGRFKSIEVIAKERGMRLK